MNPDFTPLVLVTGIYSPDFGIRLSTRDLLRVSVLHTGYAIKNITTQYHLSLQINKYQYPSPSITYALHTKLSSM